MTKKELMEIFGGIRYFTDIKVVGHTMGFTVMFSDQAVVGSGLALAAAMKLVDGSSAIFVDSTFLKAPAPVKRFLLHHELGHICHGDLEVSEEEGVARLKDRLDGAIQDCELDADRFAIEHCSAGEVGSAAAYFTGMAAMMTICRHKSARELRLRAKILRKAAKIKRDEEVWIA